MSTETSEDKVEKISDLLEERKGERRQASKAPTYLNPALGRRKNDRRTEANR